MKTSMMTFALCLALVGCAEHGENEAPVDGNDSDAGVPQDETDATWLPLQGASRDLDRYVETVCRISARCGAQPLAECRALYEGYYCQPAFRELELPDLDVCVAAREQAGCDFALQPACFAARKALVEARGARTLARKGEACDNDTIGCDYDLYCSASAGQCGQCLSPRKQGESCEQFDECGPGLYCSGEKVCSKYLLEGSACNEDTDACDVGLRCIDSKCTKFDDRDYGESCSKDEQCYAGFCVDGVCGGAVACGDGALGEPCWSDATCGDGLLCDPYSRRCRAQIADGQPCDFDDPYWCSAESYCDYADETGTSTICKPKKANGETCFSPGQDHIQECASGFCDGEEKCADPVAVCK